MGLIKCPDCGKEVSNRANACIYCGCPIGESANGVLRVYLHSIKIVPNIRILVKFEGREIMIRNVGEYMDFDVPADGKKHTAEISCFHGLLGSNVVYRFTLNSGESKKIALIFNKGWSYREEFIVCK